MTSPSIQMEAKVQITQFQALPGADAVDAELGIIRGVSMLTIGAALGHGILIDRAGLEQCLAACQERGSVRLIDKHDAEFEGIIGAVTNFRIEGDQVKGDAELFANHPMRARVLEIAQKIPTEFGLSIESDSLHIDAPDGKSKLFRCSMVDAVALVPRPAANRTGLFSARRFDTPPKPKRSATKFSKPMSKLKTALSQFAKLCKLEEGDTLDNVIDAVVEAVADNQPTVEDRLKKLEEDADPEKETSMAARLSKLEEDDKKDPDPEEEKKADEKMTALATRIADEKITKFTKEIGLTKSPSAGGGFVPLNDTKTTFEAAIATQLSAGAKDRPTAIARLAKDKPEIYNTARAAGLF